MEKRRHNETRTFQILVCLLTLFLFANHTRAEDWIFCSESAIGAVYYSKHSIKKVNENVMSIWTQNVVNEKAKTKYFSILQSVGKAPVNPHLIHYVFELSEIDCVKEKTKDLSTIIYDEKGHMLYSSPKDVAGGWNSILPDSVAEKLKNIVCRAPAASQKVVAAESAVTDNNPDQVNLLHNDMAQSGEKAVRNLITRWLNGWQSGDMKIYRSCYAPDFISRGMNRNVWSSHKTSVHRKSKNIRIRIEELQISVKENNATATFTQYYHSDIFKNSGIKKLELRKINDEWKIYREIM